LKPTLFLLLTLSLFGSAQVVSGENRDLGNNNDLDKSMQEVPIPKQNTQDGVSKVEPQRLSDVEYEELRRQVLSRCHLSSDVRSNTTPWYFHYELGLELAKRGDAERALDALLESVSRKADSQRRARIYGMWFQSYLPYFEIARVHAALGHWQCVAGALELSASHGEISVEDREFPEFDSLRLEVKEHNH
jgi:hypothetical protein